MGMHNLASGHRRTGRRDKYGLLAGLMLVLTMSGCATPQRSQTLYPVSEADGLGRHGLRGHRFPARRDCCAATTYGH
jgi:hypothetical protein